MGNAIQLHQAETAITPFAPQGLEQAMTLAKTLATSGLMPSSLKGKPQDVLVVLITGHELGLSPMQAIRSVHVVQGRAVMSADLMVALAVRSPACEYLRLVKSDDKGATYETKRRGSPEPVSMSFTIDQAKAANLTGKDNWRNYPAAMLRARCSAALVRAVYPDLALGVYEQDEAEAFTPAVHAPPPPVSVVPPAESVDAEAVEVLAQPEAPAEQDDPAARLVASVMAAESVAALTALLPAIQTAKSAGVDVTAVREAYTARRREIA
jgi:hypothetical protein